MKLFPCTGMNDRMPRVRAHQQSSLRAWSVVCLPWLVWVGTGCDNAEPRGLAFEVVEPEPPPPDPGTIEDGTPRATRLTRLTHTQYEYTVSDLLGVSTSSEGFLADPTFEGFDNNADGLRVTGRLGRDYRRSAEQLAREVSDDADLLAALSPCNEPIESCARQFVQEFGVRAFRRPLRETETARYLALYERGASFGEASDEFASGARWVIEAMLQSPNFLYRAQLGTEVDENHLVPLDDYELATRLSYMLTASMPDGALLEAAGAGALSTSEGLLEHAERLVESPAVARVVSDFHSQWLHLDALASLEKDAQVFPEFSPDLGLEFQREVLAFVQDATLDERRGLETLLTAPYTFVNEATAPLYDIEGEFSGAFERVELDPAERGGLLTQLGFLAAHAYPGDTSPIHRGVFVLRRILCADIPDPPGGIDLTLPTTDEEIVTTRDQVEAHTAADSCSVCHSLINPIGFSFENYDALGRYRATDNGAEVDASGRVDVGDESFDFANAGQLLEQLAKSEAARACYAKNWLRYAYGRSEALSDQGTLKRLAEHLRDDEYSVRNLLLDLTEPRAFTHRAPTEEE